MPDRIVRQGILTSDRVSTLTWAEEVFYRRLHSVVDDYGLYDARPSILRAQLYPLQIDRVSEPDIGKWLQATEKAGLVRKYTVDGRVYLEVVNFGQRLRQKRHKFPMPPKLDSNLLQVAVNGSPESESEVEVETEEKKKTVVGAVAPTAPPRITDTQWLGLLKGDSTYAGIDVDREYGKMLRWCEVNRKKASRKRFTNWLNRIERPMNVGQNARKYTEF